MVSESPLVFANPAGLIESASPSSVDATAAPARELEIAPVPGTNRPPARTGVLATTRVPPTTSCESFMLSANLPFAGRNRHDLPPVVLQCPHPWPRTNAQGAGSAS